MSAGRKEVLACRLGSCLRAILGLEPQLDGLELGRVLRLEFDSLKTFLRKVDRYELDEAEVARIEDATERFLEELRATLSRTAPTEAGPSTPLQ